RTPRRPLGRARLPIRLRPPPSAEGGLRAAARTQALLCFILPKADSGAESMEAVPRLAGQSEIRRRGGRAGEPLDAEQAPRKAVCEGGLPAPSLLAVHRTEDEPPARSPSHGGRP